MSLSDNIWNGLTGHNIHTIKVSAEQLAAVINDAFIRTASGTEELNRIEHTVKGSKLIFRRMDSEDGKFHRYVSYWERGLTHHRYVFVKNHETEQVFEWQGMTLGPLIRAIQPYLLQARMNPPVTPGTFTPFGFSDNNEDNDDDEDKFFNDTFNTGNKQQTPEWTELRSHSEKRGEKKIMKRICQFIAVLAWVVGIINFVKAYDYMESSSSYSEWDTIIAATKTPESNPASQTDRE